MIVTRSISRIMSFTLLGGACLAGAACAHADGPSNASLEASIATPKTTRSGMMVLASSRETPAQPIASLPDGAGAVGAVRSHEYVDGVRQDILLKGGGIRSIQDSITILARTDKRQTLDERVPLFKPTEAAIRSEIGAQFPRIAMQVVERDSSNAYGPYGLALGRTAGDVRCLYMWQWIDENKLPRDAGVSGPLSVRVRLCQAGTTFDAMAALVDHLAIGGAAQPIMVADGEAQMVSAPAADPVDIPPSHHAAGHHRKRIAKRHRDEDAAIAAAVPPGSRTMAPLSAPAPATAPTTALSSDLPPQAYLGPKSAKAY